MAAPTRDRHSSPGFASAPVEPEAAGLPVPAGDAGLLTVFSERGFAGKRRRQFPVRLLSFIVIVAVPAALAAVYYFFIAADQYVAEFRFALRSAEPERHDSAVLFQESIAPSLIGLDSYVVVQYLASRAVIDDLSGTLDLREMFSRPGADWLARLDLPVTIEEFVRYWKGQVDAFFDASNGTIATRAVRV